MDSRFLSATVGMVAVGTALGFIVGTLTRPTFLGTTLPMGLLFGSHPDDRDFKLQLISHLGITTISGLVLSAILALILVKALKL